MTAFPSPGAGGSTEFWMAGGTHHDRRAADDIRDEQSELVRRLRALAWPSPTPDVRERCLRDFEARLAALDQSDPPPKHH